MNNRELTNAEVIVKGYLWVNLPIMIIIISVWFCLSQFTDLGTGVSALFGTAIGWCYWEISIKKWVRWCLDNDIDPDRLLKIGQISLLLWNRSTIDKVLNEKK